MEKRKCLPFLFCLILCYSLFQLTARAESSSKATVILQGSGRITYQPSNSSNVNLAVIPDDWGDYRTNGKITYGSDPQILFLDYNVEHAVGYPSIRSEAHTSADVNTWRECDGTWYSVSPSDHIRITVWMKTQASSTGGGEWNGGRLGIDFYGNTNLGFGQLFQTTAEESQTGFPAYYGDNTAGTITGTYVVPWNRDWTMVGWDVIVPSYYCTGVLSGGTVKACNPVQISSFVCWLDVRPTNDAGMVWFADAELYINPT